MDIECAQRCLGAVDIEDLSTVILAQEASAWREQESRQQVYDVHEDTRFRWRVYTTTIEIRNGY